MRRRSQRQRLRLRHRTDRGSAGQNGLQNFFVSDIPEARRVRAVAPSATIYVLHGLYSGSGQAFAEINARPVIHSSIEMAEWDVFVRSHRWAGGCALHVDTGESRLGLPMEEAAAFAPFAAPWHHTSDEPSRQLRKTGSSKRPSNQPVSRSTPALSGRSCIIGQFVRHLLWTKGPFRSRASRRGALRR